MARRLKTDEIVEIMTKTQEFCDKNCKECVMFLPNVNMCFHEAERRWQAWNKKQHENFMKGV